MSSFQIVERCKRLLNHLGTLPVDIGALMIMVIVGGVYVTTLLPGVGHSGDTAKFQFVGYSLGTPHATGYPTYILLNFLFTRLFLFGSIAYRANLLSALFAICTVYFLYKLLKGQGVSKGLAFIGALTFAFTPTFWLHSLFAEVYTLHILFVAIVCYFLLKWVQSEKDRYLLIACAFYAFSFGNHLTTLMLLPAIGYLVWFNKREVLKDPKYIVLVLAFILLSAAQYLYIVWRTFDADTLYLEMSARNVKGFLWFVSGGQFRWAMFAYTPMEVLTQRIPFFLKQIWSQYSILILFIPFGIFGLRSWRISIFLGLFFATQAFYAINYRIPDIEAYFLPNYFILAIFIVVGISTILNKLPKTYITLAFSFFVLIPVALLVQNWVVVDQHDNLSKIRETIAVLETVGRNALIVTPDYDIFEYLMYYDIAEGWMEEDVYITHDFDIDDLIVYSRGEIPLPLTVQKIQAPPNLEIYLTGLKKNNIVELEAKGFMVEEVRTGLLYYISRD